MKPPDLLEALFGTDSNGASPVIRDDVTSRVVASLLSRLPDRSEAIVLRYYNGHTHFSYAQIGEEHSLSKERVRQIIAKSLRLMRDRVRREHKEWYRTHVLGRSKQGDDELEIIFDEIQKAIDGQRGFRLELMKMVWNHATQNQLIENPPDRPDGTITVMPTGTRDEMIRLLATFTDLNYIVHQVAHLLENQGIPPEILESMAEYAAVNAMESPIQSTEAPPKVM